VTTEQGKADLAITFPEYAGKNKNALFLLDTRYGLHEMLRDFLFAVLWHNFDRQNCLLHAKNCFHNL